MAFLEERDVKNIDTEAKIQNTRKALLLWLIQGLAEQICILHIENLITI